MRTRNWRLVVTGVVMIALAAGFFLYMDAIAASSNDPAELLRIVGQVSGVVAGLAVALIVVGLIGRKT